MALGATEGRVVREVVYRSALVILSGLGVGLVVALALADVMKSFLFGVQARDPGLFALVALALGVVGLAATYVPARRAGLLDPVDTIRAE